MGNWLGTFGGKRIDLDTPDPEQVTLEDIACGLSKLCRFNGQIDTFYSVAEHCLNVAALVPPEYKLQALLHDASEAYICDIPTPLKWQLGEAYCEVERRVQAAIGKRFGVDLVSLPAVIKAADKIMLVTEHGVLQKKGPPWGQEYEDVLRYPHFQPSRNTSEFMADRYINEVSKAHREYHRRKTQ